ncbi:hypothetical protein ACHAAC_02675 [Aeromicrobium sp. CF4.19]|uniref:hypothetical protein n=1 Tax=Aeromicrobium sp. CF4.19 TaxID=3373082 RepID=UPI003EE43787
MKRLALLVVGLLVAVNVVLLVAVARTDNSAAGPDGEGPDETSPAASPTSGTTEDGETTESAFGEDAAVALAVAGDGTVLRSWRGACARAGTARVDVSSDGGGGFDELALPLQPAEDGEDQESALRTVLAVQAESAEEMTVIGNNADCDVRAFTTTDGGQDWSPEEDVDDWYVAASGGELGSPAGIVMPGCDALRVDPLSDSNAKVLCSDGAIRGTNDTGVAWTLLGILPDAVDLSFTSLGEGLALVPGEECDAQVLSSGDGGGQWGPVGCASSSEPPRSLVARGETVYALAGAQVRVSTDGGATWADAGEDDEEDEGQDAVAE